VRSFDAPSRSRSRTHCWAGAVARKMRACPRYRRSSITADAPVPLWPPKSQTNRRCELMLPLPLPIPDARPCCLPAAFFQSPAESTIKGAKYASARPMAASGHGRRASRFDADLRTRTQWRAGAAAKKTHASARGLPSTVTGSAHVHLWPPYPYQSNSATGALSQPTPPAAPAARPLVSLNPGRSASGSTRCRVALQPQRTRSIVRARRWARNGC